MDNLGFIDVIQVKIQVRVSSGVRAVMLNA
jgi:hypothetical protein